MHVQVFGFGSHFSNKEQGKDIDLLLVHQNISMSSCKFALRCKASLIALLPKLDISILSNAESNSLDFRKRANAISIGKIQCANFDLDILDTVTNIKLF